MLKVLQLGATAEENHYIRQGLLLSYARSWRTHRFHCRRYRRRRRRRRHHHRRRRRRRRHRNRHHHHDHHHQLHQRQLQL